MEEVLKLEISKLELRPGDYLAVKCSDVSLARAEQLAEYLNEILPEGVKALLFVDDARLAIMRPKRDD